jgi:DNA-binding GntR family transcriptional regulator
VTETNVASDRIADTLRAAILDGSYLPGTRIRQEDVAARSGASRIPVREAFRLLASEGLVTLVANTGAWVTRLSLDECVETYLPNLDQTAIGRLAELNQAMAATGTSVAEFLRLDREFHLSSYAGAPPGETSQIIGRMWNTTQHYRREFTKLAAGAGAGMDVTHLEHRLLLDCIGRRDADDAERVLVTHIRRTRLALEQHPEIFG